MFELPASYDSNGEMTVLPLEANQVGFSNYYVAEGLGSPFSDTAPAYLSGFILNSNDADWEIYDESLTFSQSGYLFGGQITNDQPDPISFADQNYTYEKPGQTQAFFLTMFMAIPSGIFSLLSPPIQAHIQSLLIMAR